MLIKTDVVKPPVSPMEQTVRAEETENSLSKGPAFGKRHLQVMYLLLLITIEISTGSNLSKAMKAIAGATFQNPDTPTYDWQTEAVVLSSFYWGCVVLQVFAGQLGITYGPKYLLVGAVFVNSTACVLIPTVALHLGTTGLIVCRIVQGLAHGFFFPSVHNLLGQWVPKTERSRLCLLAYSGTPFSCILSKIVWSYVSESWAGWSTMCYLFGGLGYPWIILWILYGSNSPAEHRTITEAERNYIQNSLDVKAEPQVLRTPWKAIFTSLPVWAVVIAYLGQTWGASILLNQTPEYIEEVMKFDMISHRLLSVAPNIAVFVLSFGFVFVSDYMVTVKLVPRTTARKIFTTIGMTVPLIGLIPQAFVPENTIYLSVILLFIAVGSSAATCTGSFANIMDLSPRYSGIVMGISNGSASLFSIATPFLIHHIVTDTEDKTLWTKIFIITSCFYISANIFYIMFASGKVQWWHSSNDKPDMKNDKEPEKAEEVFKIDICYYN